MKQQRKIRKLAQDYHKAQKTAPQPPKPLTNIQLYTRGVIVAGCYIIGDTAYDYYKDSKNFKVDNKRVLLAIGQAAVLPTLYHKVVVTPQLWLFSSAVKARHEVPIAETVKLLLWQGFYGAILYTSNVAVFENRLPTLEDDLEGGFKLGYWAGIKLHASALVALLVSVVTPAITRVCRVFSFSVKYLQAASINQIYKEDFEFRNQEDKKLERLGLALTKVKPLPIIEEEKKADETEGTKTERQPHSLPSVSRRSDRSLLQSSELRRFFFCKYSIGYTNTNALSSLGKSGKQKRSFEEKRSSLEQIRSDEFPHLDKCMPKLLEI